MPSDDEKECSAASGSVTGSNDSDEGNSEDDAAGPATVDVLRYGKSDSAKHVTVPSGTGTQVVAAHRRDASRSRLVRTLVVVALALAAAVAGTVYADVTVGVLAAVVVAVLSAALEYLRGSPVPDLVDEAVHSETAEEEYEVKFHVEEPLRSEGESIPDKAG